MTVVTAIDMLLENVTEEAIKFLKHKEQLDEIVVQAINLFDTYLKWELPGDEVDINELKEEAKKMFSMYLIKCEFIHTSCIQLV